MKDLCRGVPALKKYYEEFKGEKKFSVIGISLDKDKKKWKQFVESRKLDYDHVCDGKGWKSKLAKKYKVSSIPAYFLLDPQGTIRFAGSDKKLMSRITRFMLDEMKRAEGSE